MGSPAVSMEILKRKNGFGEEERKGILIFSVTSFTSTFFRITQLESIYFLIHPGCFTSKQMINAFKVQTVIITMILSIYQSI